MAKKPDIWMPLYVSDFLTKTARLNDAETGAYMLLLMHSWAEGGALPDVDSDLARMARTSAVKWKTMRQRIEPFFTVSGGVWTQKRLLEELGKAQKSYDSKSMNGRKGGRPPKLTETEQEPAGFVSPNRTETQPQPHIQKQRSKAKPARTSATPPALPDWLPRDIWGRFLEHRDAIEKPMTEFAQTLAFKKLADLMADGSAPVGVIEQSILSRWSGLFPLKRDGPQGRQSARSATVAQIFGGNDERHDERVIDGQAERVG